MKLQPASQKEVKRMAIGSLRLAAVELAGFLLLHLLGIVPFSYRILLSAAGGVAVSLFSFILLCLAVQQAAGMTDQKAMKARMQLSYHVRLLLQAGWVVIAFLTPFLHVFAAAVPLLFPTIIIFTLQKQSKPPHRNPLNRSFPNICEVKTYGNFHQRRENHKGL